MKGLILVGGYGTRLRPLTLSVPKPLIEFCNRPILEYQIRALAEVGVKHVILAVAYQPDAMKSGLEEVEKQYNIKLSYSIEQEPLLTAGPIRLARDLLLEDEAMDEPFFVLNSDVICEFPLADMVNYHKKHGREGTILATKVEDPSKFGVIVHDHESGVIEKFIEKPSTFVGDYINAGIYLFNKSIINRIELRPTSIEKETFPQMAAESQLRCFRLNGFWADIGQPKDFLTGTRLYLATLKTGTGDADPKSPVSTLVAPSDKGPVILGNVLIHPTAKVAINAVIGPNVTIGPNCIIEDGVRIRDTSVLADTRVSSHSYIDGSIIGWNCSVGKWTRTEGLTVLGQSVGIADLCYINGALVLPFKQISQSVYQPGQILM